MVVAVSLATSDLPDDIGLSHAWMRQGAGVSKVLSCTLLIWPFCWVPQSLRLMRTPAQHL